MACVAGGVQFARGQVLARGEAATFAFALSEQYRQVGRLTSKYRQKELVWPLWISMVANDLFLASLREQMLVFFFGSFF